MEDKMTSTSYKKNETDLYLLEKQEEYRKLTDDKKYTQKWLEYNKAQTREKIYFYRLLHELLNIIPERVYKFGRPHKSLRDMLFCCLVKVYVNTSSRRTTSDLILAQKAGYIKEAPHFNTVLNYFNDDAVKIVLKYLINISSLPLRNVEERFAVDSTGFGTSVYDRWFNARTGKDSTISRYRKCHAICGVKTNIITYAEITEGKAADVKMFKGLVEKTAEGFLMREVSADKAYSSRENLELAKKLGALPFIPFKINTTGKAKGSPTWETMYRLFTENYIEFASHYHQRSNIESCFNMIKTKFSDFVRTRKPKSQDNEILCKILCHNIVVLIHEMFEQGIEIDFKELPAQKVEY